MTAPQAGPPKTATRCIGGALNGLFIEWVVGGGAVYYTADGTRTVPPRPADASYDEVYEPQMHFTANGNLEQVMSFVHRIPRAAGT